jgi:hypothetical protein
MSHLHCLKVSHTDQCHCDTAPQTPTHILKDCSLYDTLQHSARQHAPMINESFYIVQYLRQRRLKALGYTSKCLEAVPAEH